MPTLTVHTDPAPSIIEPIAEGLRRYDEAMVGPQRRTTLAVVARSDAGETVAGIHGWVAWGWGFVERLWVAESLRRHGLGARLLRRFEAEARGHGARSVALFTASWQAPGFYHRQGYRTVGTFDPGGGHGDARGTADTNHLLVRELDAPTAR